VGKSIVANSSNSLTSASSGHPEPSERA
jgi:hypothetical protein